MPTKPTAGATHLRIAILALVGALLAGVMIALACAPAAPTGQQQPLPLCNAERSNPETDGCIKPTEGPTSTALPTPTTPTEVAPARPAAASATPTATPSLTDQITDAAQSDDYDAIARVKAISRRHVTIKPTEKNFIPEWTRTRLEVVDTLRGALPESIEIVTPAGARNASLDVDGSYILFLRKSFVDADSSQFPGDPTRAQLTQAELTEFEGEAYIYFGRQVWAIDGATAIRVPSKGHLLAGEPAVMTDLQAAKAHGETMTLAGLEQMLRPADN